MRAWRALHFLPIAALVLSAAVCNSKEEPVQCAATKPVSFDAFMSGLGMAHVPIEVPVPSGYEQAELDEEMDAYSFWTPPDEVAAFAKTEKPPTSTGYMYGKLSLSVFYDAQKQKFFGGEAGLLSAPQRGIRQVHAYRASVNGHALLFMDLVFTTANRKVSFMFVALNHGSYVAYLTYVPPEWNDALGECYWKRFRESAKAVPVATATTGKSRK